MMMHPIFYCVLQPRGGRRVCTGMLEIEAHVAPDADLTRAEASIEAACAAEGLRLTLKGTLKKYPGCIHWHYKKDLQPGTLEITLWPQARRLWFKVAAGRTGAWIDEILARLKIGIERALLSLD